jgi:hypothetical protein
VGKEYEDYIVKKLPQFAKTRKQKANEEEVPPPSLFSPISAPNPALPGPSSLGQERRVTPPISSHFPDLFSKPPEERDPNPLGSRIPLLTLRKKSLSVLKKLLEDLQFAILHQEKKRLELLLHQEGIHPHPVTGLDEWRPTSTRSNTRNLTGFTAIQDLSNLGSQMLNSTLTPTHLPDTTNESGIPSHSLPEQHPTGRRTTSQQRREISELGQTSKTPSTNPSSQYNTPKSHIEDSCNSDRKELISTSTLRPFQYLHPKQDSPTMEHLYASTSRMDLTPKSESRPSEPTPKPLENGKQPQETPTLSFEKLEVIETLIDSLIVEIKRIKAEIKDDLTPDMKTYLDNLSLADIKTNTIWKLTTSTTSSTTSHHKKEMQTTTLVNPKTQMILIDRKTTKMRLMLSKDHRHQPANLYPHQIMKGHSTHSSMPCQSRKDKSSAMETATGARKPDTNTGTVRIERSIWPNMAYDKLPAPGLPRKNPTKGRNPRDP